MIKLAMRVQRSRPMKVNQLLSRLYRLMSSNSDAARMIKDKNSTVAACIIGDEVLNGRTIDTNSNYLAKKCFEYGLDLGEIRVIPDVKSVISRTIRQLSSEFSLVVTSGGIGPTHDDVTYESIAEAFTRPLIYDDPTINRMRDARLAKGDAGISDVNFTQEQLKMALIPTPDKVFVTPGLWQPLVQVKNVLILPGVPSLFCAMLKNWFENDLNQADLVTSKKIRRQIKTTLKESALAKRLGEIQQHLEEEEVKIGSYPHMNDDGSTHVILSILLPEKLGSKRIADIVQEISATFDGHEIKI